MRAVKLTVRGRRTLDWAPWKACVMLGNLTGVHFIILAGVIVLLFGATKLPVFSKNLGQSIKIFRKEITDVKTDIREDRKADSETAEPVYSTNEPAAGARRIDGTGSSTPGSSDR